MANQVSLIPREIKEAGFPVARFLSEEEQAKYEEACKQYSGKAREVLNIGRNGSNLFKVLLLNQIGIRTASLGELESALENGLALQDQYEDAPAIVLRSASDSYEPNDYLAKTLSAEIRVKKVTAPLVITGLELVLDKNSKYGLSFKKTDKTEAVEAPCLSHKNNQKRFSRINPDYSDEFDDKANRTLWTRDNGISRLYLGWDLLLYSGDGLLASSGDYGRVVVVNNAEGIAKNFDAYLTQLNSEKERQAAEIEKRYADALRVLKGK